MNAETSDPLDVPVSDPASPGDVAHILTLRRAHLSAKQGRARTKTRAALLGARINEVAQLHDQLAARGVARPRTDVERSNLEVRE